MSEHEVSRVVQAPSSRVFEVVADLTRLPEWLPTVQAAGPADPATGTDVHVEGSAGGSSYASDGFWRPRPEQLRVEWSQPSRGGEPSRYAGWLQLEDQNNGGCEVVVHLSFVEPGTGDDTGAVELPAPEGVDRDLAAALDALADLVER
ncbi:MAG: SRPBCC family protein [Actinomycetota bacterium]|nr:SRPBCC family protein [Actinomycetota bacterium]